MAERALLRLPAPDVFDFDGSSDAGGTIDEPGHVTSMLAEGLESVVLDHWVDVKVALIRGLRRKAPLLRSSTIGTTATAYLTSA